MNYKKIAQDIFNLSENTIYETIDKFKENHGTDKSLVFCFIKAFYLYTVKVYSEKEKVTLDFKELYKDYKENLKAYYKTNNPDIEEKLLDQILNFFDNSFALITTIGFSEIEDSYKFRHDTINIFEVLRMILEKKSKATIPATIFDKDIRIIIQQTETILNYIKTQVMIG